MAANCGQALDSGGERRRAGGKRASSSEQVADAGCCATNCWCRDTGVARPARLRARRLRAARAVIASRGAEWAGVLAPGHTPGEAKRGEGCVRLGTSDESCNRPERARRQRRITDWARRGESRVPMGTGCEGDVRIGAGGESCDRPTRPRAGEGDGAGSQTRRGWAGGRAGGTRVTRGSVRAARAALTSHGPERPGANSAT